MAVKYKKNMVLYVLLAAALARQSGVEFTVK